MAQSAYPAQYTPAPLPRLTDNLNIYLHGEMRKVQETLDGVLNLLPQIAAAAPTRPMNGMIRYAQSPWQPISGQTSPLWVIYGPAGWTAL